MTDTFNIYDEKNNLVANGASPVEVQKLIPATKYIGWKISRKTEQGESDKVSIASFVTFPEKPMLNIVAGDSKVSYSIINPSEGSELTDYIIYYSDGKTEKIFDAKTSLTGSIESLVNDQEYSFQVTAKNAGGESEKSDVVKSTPKKA